VWMSMLLPVPGPIEPCTQSLSLHMPKDQPPLLWWVLFAVGRWMHCNWSNGWGGKLWSLCDAGGDYAYFNWCLC
jgi:hypothetical protein